MLTPQQLTLLKTNSSTTGSPGVSPTQAMTPEQAQAWISGTTSQTTPKSDPLASVHLGGAETDSAGKIGEAFNSGIKQVSEGVSQAMKPGEAAGNMPLGVLKAGAGVVNTAFSPLAPAMKPLGDAVNAIADKVSNSPQVQDFAQSKAGEYSSKAAEGALNADTIAAGLTMGAKTPEVGAAIKDTAVGIKNDLTPKPPTPEEAAASKAQQVASQKATSQAAALKAHDLIDKEVRNIAEKYPTVGDALNKAEVTRGSEPIKVLASYPEGKALPTMTKGGKMNSIPAMNFLKTQISELGKLKENLVGTAKETTPIKDFRQAAFDRIDKGSGSLAKKAADKADVAKIIDGLKATYPEGIPTNEMDKIKTEQANESKSYNSKSPFSADSHALVGQTAADAVVTQGGAAPIDELNQLLSSHYDAIKVLKAMQGKTPHGGMFSRHMGGIAGEVAGLAGGLAVGHPFIGAMVGRGASEMVNNILSNHFISNPLKRALITGMKGERPEVIQKALDFIDSSENTPESTPTESTPQLAQKGQKSTSTNNTTLSPKEQGGTPNMREGGTITPNESNTNVADNSRGLLSRAGSFVKEAVDRAKNEGERGFIKNPFKDQYAGEKDLTNPILDKLEGRTSVSKTFIQDLTNSPELKQADRDLVRGGLKDYPNGNIPVKEFANKVKTELLPLKVIDREGSGGGGTRNIGRYEHVTLSDELKGPVANYGERLYTSPIKTSAGDVHFSGQNGLDSYFAHTRIEDLPALKTEPYLGDLAGGKKNYVRGKLGNENAGTTRRIIEIQSDLFQKGRLEDEVANKPMMSGADLAARKADLAPLEPYRNTWQDRIISEEVKQAAKDGKTKLQFPTGETAMKIEGLGDTSRWVQGEDHAKVIPEDLEAGKIIRESSDAGVHGGEWVITQILGDGKFKAVPMRVIEDGDLSLGEEFSSPSDALVALRSEISTSRNGIEGTSFSGTDVDDMQEQFDISGKVDTNNPIYKFYEKEVGRYLKNKFGAKEVTDPQGVKWVEVNITKDMAKRPVSTFSGLGQNVERKQ